MKLHYLKIWTYLQPLFRKFWWKRLNCKFHSHFTARSSVEDALAWVLWSLTKKVQKSSKWNLASWKSWGWSLYSPKSTFYAALDCREWIFVTSNTRIKEAFQGGFWCRFVAHFPTHLSPIWLETNVAVVFSLQYNCRCRFFARIQMFAKRT